MRVAHRVLCRGRWDQPAEGSPQLALAFGSRASLVDPAVWTQLEERYPHTLLVGCSTAGEILDTRIVEDSVVVTELSLEHGRFEVAAAPVENGSVSGDVGAALAAALPGEGLIHVLVISDGISINGSALVAGLLAALPPTVTLSGGLSADGDRFVETIVGTRNATSRHQVVAIGMYSPRLHVGFGSRGGWDPFGPERRITRSHGNILYELDGKPALDLYKRYLGKHSDTLPAGGLGFPIAVRPEQGGAQDVVVRTLLNVDESAQTMTFAGDVPEGYRARLMRANFERLIDGATEAAAASLTAFATAAPQFALLVSCVGRRLVLKQRAEEEVEAVRSVLGAPVPMSGFYSYGELSPTHGAGTCALHNQTMTITTFAER